MLVADSRRIAPNGRLLIQGCIHCAASNRFNCHIVECVITVACRLAGIRCSCYAIDRLFEIISQSQQVQVMRVVRLFDVRVGDVLKTVGQLVLAAASETQTQTDERPELEGG